MPIFVLSFPSLTDLVAKARSPDPLEHFEGSFLSNSKCLDHGYFKQCCCRQWPALRPSAPLRMVVHVEDDPSPDGLSMWATACQSAGWAAPFGRWRSPVCVKGSADAGRAWLVSRRHGHPSPERGHRRFPGCRPRVPVGLGFRIFGNFAACHSVPLCCNSIPAQSWCPDMSWMPSRSR